MEILRRGRPSIYTNSPPFTDALLLSFGQKEIFFEEPMQAEALKKKGSLRISLLDGIFASGMFGFTQDYFTPFILAIGATARGVGALSALPNLFASMVQLKSADFIEMSGSRKPI